MPFEPFLLSSLRAVVEVAGLALLGRAVLGRLAGELRQQNLIYKLFDVVASPVLAGVRTMTPRVVADGLIPWLAFFLLFSLWLALGLAKLRF